MVDTRHRTQDQILSNAYPSIRYQINLLSYLLENRPLGVSVPNTLDYCNFLDSYRLIVDGINLGEVAFGSVENCISNGVSLFHTQAAAKRITATKVLHGGKPSPVILWSREAQLVAAVANVAALLQFSHVWCKIPSGGGYANYIWRPRKRLQPNSKATRRAITEARIQERSSKGQHGIIKSFEAPQQLTRKLALYVLLLSIGVALSYITLEGFVDSNTVRATLAWDTNNEHHTLGDDACSKMNCQGHVLTLMVHFAHFIFKFMLTGLAVCVISKIKHIIGAEGLILTCEPPVKKGRTRVRWTCSCKHTSYDDFEKLGAGAAKEMQRSLMSIEGKSRSRSTDGKSGRSQGIIAKSVGDLGGYLKSIWPPWKLQEDAQRLPTHAAPQNRHATSGLSAPVSESLYVLLCIPFSRYGTKCIHMDLCSLHSDQAFFKNLRVHYIELRGKWKSKFSLRQLVGIRFVRFGMYKSELADIQKYDDIPPESKKHEYRYNPIPAETIPPIGSNHMMHLYDHPEHAEVEATCVDKIPKKLREKLRLYSNQGTRLGWGICFDEGLNWFMVWVLGSIGLLLSMVFGLLWTCLRDDMQGGFGVAACMMMTFVFTAGILQTAFG
ncbi:MAG: hypothetical protein Q9205_001429 [Flavoplaca limonia]